MRGRQWQKNELLAAFALYCKTTFGKLHRQNPDIIRLADALERSPSSVAMKLCNFAGIDPVQSARDVSGLKNASRKDHEIWHEFEKDPEAVLYLSHTALAEVLGNSIEKEEEAEEYGEIKETEAFKQARVRLVQGLFRRTVLTSYEYTCAVCGLGVMELLNASHIIPWRVDKSRRADPRNGIAMCTLHDRAFDRGLIAVDEQYRILLSPKLKEAVECEVLRAAFWGNSVKRLNLPHRFTPEDFALQYHRSIDLCIIPSILLWRSGLLF